MILSVALLSTYGISYAQYYKTLPKGVRTIDMRNIKTSNITSSYNHSQSETPYSYNIELDSKTLQSIDNSVVNTIFGLLDPYPDAKNALSLGQYKISGNANIEVDVFGVGVGLTNKITAYVGLPIYKANIRMQYARPQGNNYDQVAGILQNYVGDDFAQGIGQNIEAYGQNLDIDGSFLQNLVVNHFNYNPVGDWSGEGPGDAEFGVMYNFLQKDNWGLMLTFGGVAPTGRVDDPDTLQDISFGDGQWDAFVEFGGGIELNKNYILNSWFRYTYQFANDRELRVPYSQDVFIGDQKGIFNQKLGNKFTYHISGDYITNDWISFSAAYEYTQTGKAKYQALNSDHAYAESILASNTDSSQHNLRLSGTLSSITPFMKNKFLLPASIRFTYQHMLHGHNTPKMDMYEVAFRMFF
jgi:hypothetical protein